MIKTRMRKILRDVIARKGRTFLVSLAIFIGVAGTITLFSMSDIIVKQLEEDIQEDKLSMLLIFTTTATDREINNEADYAAISNYEGLTSVIAANQANFYFKQDPDDEDFQDALLTGFNLPLENLPLEPMRLVSGSWPTADAKQIVVEKRMGEEFGIEVGDTLTLRILGRAAENGTEATEDWTVSGIVFHPYAQSPDTAAYALLPDVELIGGIKGFNAILARFETFEMAQDSSLPFRTHIAENTPYRAVFTQEQDPEKNQLIEGARQIGQLLGTIAIMALLVSGFLVVNVITSIVIEQKRLIGVMKSLGATRADNFMMYSGLAFMYGIIGVIPGVIVGIIGGQVAANLLGPELNTVISGFSVSLGSVMIGVIIGLLVPVIASLLPVFNGTRVTILEAMTDLGIASSNVRNKLKFEMDMRWYEMVLFVLFLPLILVMIIGGVLFTFFVYIPIYLMMAAILWVLQRVPMPLNLRHGINSVAVKKRRLVLTVFTLALAVGAFMGIFSIFSSISEGLNSYLDTFNVQIFVLPSPGQDTNAVETALASYPEIEAAEPGVQLQIEFENFDWEPAGGGPPVLLAYGYDVNSPKPAFDYELESGEGLNDANRQTGIILSNALADKMEKDLNDTVVALLAGERLEMTIVGIADFPIDQVWLDWRTMAELSGSLNPDGSPAAQGYLLVTDDDEATAREIDDLMEKLNESLVQNGVNAQMFNFVELVDQITQAIFVFQAIFSGVALLIAFVGALGLLTALSISVFERQKEIGVMRSIGAGSGTVAIQFLTEGLLVGLIAWIVGIPISIVFSELLISAAGLGDTFQIDFSEISLVIGLVGLMIITTIASIGPSLGAARKTVSDILRYQ